VPAAFWQDVQLQAGEFMKSVFIILVHAHDYLWRTKAVELGPRLEACQLIWKAAIAVPAGTMVEME